MTEEQKLKEVLDIIDQLRKDVISMGKEKYEHTHQVLIIFTRKTGSGVITNTRNHEELESLMYHTMNNDDEVAKGIIDATRRFLKDKINESPLAKMLSEVMTARIKDFFEKNEKASDKPDEKIHNDSYEEEGKTDGQK